MSLTLDRLRAVNIPLNVSNKPNNLSDSSKGLSLYNDSVNLYEALTLFGSSAAITDLSNTVTTTGVTIVSSSGADTLIASATTTQAGVMSAIDKTNLSALITLSGVSSSSINLGAFSGSIIPDNSTIKAALQALETSVQTIPVLTTGNLTSINSAITITSGTDSVIGSGTSVTFNPSNVLLSTLGGSLDITQITTTGATLGQFLIFDGTNWVSTTYTPPVAEHNSLTGKQGGTALEYYHLDAQVYNAIYNLAGGEILGKASYLGAPQLQAITLDHSIVMNLTTGTITLVNDVSSPGNEKYYGTDGTGTRGFFDVSTFAGISEILSTNTADITISIIDPTTAPDISAVLTTTTVTNGSYGSASNIGTFTVDSKGRLTAAANVPISISSISITDFDEAVDDRVSSLLIAGTNIVITYDDLANTITIDSTTGGITGTGVANRVAYWTSTTDLGNDADFTFDGSLVTIGSPAATSARLTTKGIGGTVSTYGFIHQNSTNTEVFKVTDKGSLFIGALNELDIHPDYFNIATGGTFPINVAGGNLSLFSDLTVVVEGGGSPSNTPSFKSVATRSTNIGDCINAQIEGVFAMNAGTNRYSDLLITTNVNQSGGTSPIRSIYVKPVLTAATNYVGLEINAPGHTALKTTAGDVSFTLGGDAEGDLYYRGADGNLVNLGIGGPTEVLGSTGTVPAWTTTAGSLPGGANGDVLMYVSGTWASASPTIEKQTGITGPNVTLGATPLGSTLFTLYRNGVYQDETDDYSRVGTAVTMVSDLVTTDKLTIIYYT